ncbi:integrin alpha-D-like [Narcine bancroftii]|uniref:integrin alpha-D-like n=1 Tax=Narcine bancroftii TaxID=1343680 RepID=UPI003831A371
MDQLTIGGLGQNQWAEWPMAAPMPSDLTLLSTPCSLPSARYVHFRRDEQGQRDVIHRYKVENLGPYPVPLTLTLSLAMFPLGWVSWDVEVLFEAPLHEEKACRNLKEGAPLNSTGSKVFKQMVCQLLSLPNSFTTFDLKGSIIPLGKTEESLVILSSCVTLSLNSSSFINDDLDVSLEAESQTEVQIVAYSRKSLLIYSSVGGLLLLILIIFILWKFGFFKRRSKVIEEKMIGASRDTDPRATANEQEAAASEKQELANGEEAPANGTEE